MADNDDAATLRLLWRADAPAAPARPGPRARVTVDQVVDAAVDLADTEGLDAVAMRPLAKRLGVGAMSLYTHVSGREQLLSLMVDQAMGRTELPAHPDDLRARLRQVAVVTYDEVTRHPWLPDAAGHRPVMGPHSSARYEWQLTALEGRGLDDVEMDQAVALLAGFATNAARAAHAARVSATQADTAWWEAVAPVLDEVMPNPDAYPVSSRVGSAAGLAYGAASDAGREYEFGLERIVDGLVGLVEARRG